MIPGLCLYPPVVNNSGLASIGALWRRRPEFSLWPGGVTKSHLVHNSWNLPVWELMLSKSVQRERRRRRWWWPMVIMWWLRRGGGGLWSMVIMWWLRRGGGGGLWSMVIMWWLRRGGGGYDQWLSCDDWDEAEAEKIIDGYDDWDDDVTFCILDILSWINTV